MTHTKGPWVYDADEETITAGGAVIVALNLSDFPCLDEDEHDLDAVAAELEANARLIAAAPEMYERLRDAREALANLDLTWLDDHGEGLCTAIDEVLRSASGEAT